MKNKKPLELIENIYNEHYIYLRNFLKGLTKSDEVADDIIQELFTKILKDPSKVLEVTHIKSWLVKSAKNTFLDHYKKKKPELLSEEGVIESLLINNQTPESEYILNSQIQAALNQLLKNDKAIFLAKFYYGYSYEEISTLFDISIPTLKSKIFRFRKKMVKEVRK
ncbi:RNA polymerase sigma factor [Halalkalibacter okhensis]|uniref:RNA polymerase n=1 Tax=Halalkalibacter okhensis TaxID=333138 RepID=A0A0B0IA05_9BACI|nr:RNA polymerase sigma factor [Halalkalibacter okhensis]KHF38130.1 RNA polymerase [Halalkalibacter okhensis]